MVVGGGGERDCRCPYDVALPFLLLPHSFTYLHTHTHTLASPTHDQQNVTAALFASTVCSSVFCGRYEKQAAMFLTLLTSELTNGSFMAHIHIIFTFSCISV